jgi:hypothetical protein
VKTTQPAQGATDFGQLEKANLRTKTEQAWDASLPPDWHNDELLPTITGAGDISVVV